MTEVGPVVVGSLTLWALCGHGRAVVSWVELVSIHKGCLAALCRAAVGGNWQGWGWPGWETQVPWPRTAVGCGGVVRVGCVEGRCG